jgi:SAM-dependent methyltransferase
MSDRSERGYQHGFSEQFPVQLNFPERRRKARKIVRILEEQISRPLSDLRGLEIGSSGGGMSVVFAKAFGFFFAGDIDLRAIEQARRENGAANLAYAAIDAMTLPFPARAFDVVICNHVYEHMPDAHRLIREVERVLTAGGVCYFGCGNRFVLLDGEYGLPLLSILPRQLASLYVRLFRGGTEYYEETLFYWQLKRLVAEFELKDWTWNVLLDPERYDAAAELPSWSRSLRYVPDRLRRLLTPFLPSYLWTLRKREDAV